MEDKIEVFIAFDEEDLDLLKELKKHLRFLETEGLITVWDASQIVGGTDWKQAINDHLKMASIILLLVSANFMASPVYELAKQAVAKNAPPKVYVIPVLLHEVDWENSDFSTLAPLPSNRKPIGSWSNLDAACVSVVKGIREIVAELKASEEPLPEMEKVTVDSDHIEYRIEDQPWYASNFPQTREIDQEQAKGLSGEIDVVIITATDEEMRAVMRHLEPYSGRKSALLAFVGPETYYLGKFGVYKAVVTKCRMGSIGEGSVISATSQAQEVWHPKAIIMIGIAFGKDPGKQKIGDVLVASQIISYEQQRVGEQVIFRGSFPPSNATLLNRFENAPTWHFARPDGKLCDLLVGPILSGEKLVDDPRFKLHLFQQFPQAIGGEMEGAGLCATSGRVGVAWILVKSICDWGDGKKHKQHQPLAAAAAVSLVHHVLSQKTALNSIKKPFNDLKSSTNPPHGFSLRLQPFQRRIVLSIGLALLIVIGSIGLFFSWRINQITTEHVNATATARAQLTASANALAKPIVAAMGILKLDESLTKNSNAGWAETRRACTFATDGYHVISSAQAATPQLCIARNLNPFSDFTFQIQMNILRGTAGGILFRLTRSLGYYFRISKDGHYALLACRGTDCSNMLVNNVSSYYDPNKQPNTLAVVVRGTHIELFVNNVLIDDRADDSSSLQGQIGMAAETGSEVVFSEAKVWTPTPPPLELGKNTLHMTWRGSGGDQHIYWTLFDGTTWSPQQRVSDFQTRDAPPLAMSQSTLFLVWRGVEGDLRIFWASFNGTKWSDPSWVSEAQTSYAPALVIFQGTPFLVWRGAETDSRIFWASFNGTKWSGPLQVPGVRTSNAPAVAIFQNTPFLVWKGMEGDPHMYWSRFDGAKWSPQKPVPVGEASSAPALAMFQSRLFMVWKGIGGDPGIYWTSFDGATKWSGQGQVPGVGTSSAPALAVSKSSLFMVWKGIGGDQSIYWRSFDGTATWSKPLPIPGVGTNNAPALATF